MSNEKVIVNVADLMEANGKTWRENNLAKEHKIGIGRLVEVISSGLRLYVFGHGRDCDGTPLYHLTADVDLIGEEVWNKVGYPDNFNETAEIYANGVFSGAGDMADRLLAAKCFLAMRLGEKQGKILWNHTSDDGLRVVDIHMVDEAKEREMFEAEIKPHFRIRNEHGDYVLPAIQIRWVGWHERAVKKEYTTLDTEAWKNPFIPLEERIQIVDGAVAWRNEVIANLRKQIEDLKGNNADIRKVVAERSGMKSVDHYDIEQANADFTKILVTWYQLTFDLENGYLGLPLLSMLKAVHGRHQLTEKFDNDDKLKNLYDDLENTIETHDTQYALRLAFRQPIRRMLRICIENDIDIKGTYGVDLDYNQPSA